MSLTPKRNKWVWVEISALGGCVGLAAMMSAFVIMSWWGGDEGVHILRFNLANERMVETVVFPLVTIIGAIAVFRAAWQKPH